MAALAALTFGSSGLGAGASTGSSDDSTGAETFWPSRSCCSARSYSPGDLGDVEMEHLAGLGVFQRNRARRESSETTLISGCMEAAIAMPASSEGATRTLR